MNLLPILTSFKIEKPIPGNINQGKLGSYLPQWPWLTFFGDSLEKIIRSFDQDH